MNKFSRRLKIALQENNMKAIDLAKKTGISKSSISDWLSGKYEAKQDKVFVLAETLGVDEGWLMGLDVPMRKSRNINFVYDQLNSRRKKNVYKFAERQLEAQKEIAQILVYGQTAAGEPITYGDPEVEEKEVSYVPDGADMALLVNGDSMEDIIPDGSIVFYKRQPSVENGEIAIVEIEGDGVTCKRVKYDYDNEKIVLESENEKYVDMVFDSDQIRILGKVLL